MLRDPFDRDVFVAYAGADRALAESVVDALRAVELRVFIDVDLLPGAVWPSASGALVATLAERVRAAVDDARVDDPQPPEQRTPVESDPSPRPRARLSATSAAVCG